MRIASLSLLLLPAAAGCAWSAAGSTGCEPIAPPRPLPLVLRESSGVTWSHRRPDILWSHNDSGHPAEIYALDLEGRLLGVYPLQGARNQDWEDIAAGPCDGGSCLYVGDIGDNAELRARVVLYRVAEPTELHPADPQPRPLPVEVFPMLLPGGPRDMEALFVLPGEELYFITKGRNHPVTVYRYPPPLRAGVVTLEEVQTLSEGPVSLPSQVTGADASPDGEVVVVRTYDSMTFYRMEEGFLVPLEGGRVSLRTLEEPQGEGVALGPGGKVALTNETGPFGGVAALRLLRCSALTW